MRIQLKIYENANNFEREEVKHAQRECMHSVYWVSVCRIAQIFLLSFKAYFEILANFYNML